MSEALNEREKHLLLAIVDNPHSDYDESVDGYPNFWVYESEGINYLYVTLQQDDQGFSGTWKLEFVTGNKSVD